MDLWQLLLIVEFIFLLQKKQKTKKKTAMIAYADLRNRDP